MTATRPQTPWVLGLALATALGCSKAETAVPGAGDVGTTLDVGLDVHGSADSGGADTVLAVDVPVDALPVDTTTADTSAADTSAADTSAADLFAPDTTEPPDSALAETSTPDLFACASSADCTVIETKCCDHCNGGEALAVAVATQAEALAKFGPTGCGGVACTEKACPPAKAACEKHHCVLQGATPACVNTASAKLCVRGKPVADGELIEVGSPITVQVYPKGCFSSSCTSIVTATCTALPGNVTTFITGQFCLTDVSAGGACTPDCSGGGFAECEAGTWAQGTWPFSLDGTIVQVTAPSKLPFGGTCAGNPF